MDKNKPVNELTVNELKWTIAKGVFWGVILVWLLTVVIGLLFTIFTGGLGLGMFYMNNM